MNPNNELNEFISRVIKDYKRKRALKGSLLGLLTGVLLILMIYLIRFLIIFNISLLVIVIVTFFLVFVGGILGFILPIPIKKLIALVDKKENLNEMLITYYDYEQQDKDNRFLPLIRDRLASTIKEIEIEGIFKVNIQKEIRIIFLSLILLTFLTIWIDFAGTYQLSNSKSIVPRNFYEEDESLSSYQKETHENDKLGENQAEQGFGQIARQDSSDPSNFEFGFNSESSSTRDNEQLIWNDDNKLERSEEALSEQGDEYTAEDGAQSQSSSRESDDDLWNVTDEENKSGQEETVDDRNESEGDEMEESEVDEDGSSSNDSASDSERGEKRGSGRSRNVSEQKREEQNSSKDSGIQEYAEEAGDGPGNQLNNDDFQALNQEYDNSKLQSQNNNNYYNRYVEELLRSDKGGSDSGISDGDLINYRDYLLNSLENDRIPANYKDMVRDYYRRITQE